MSRSANSWWKHGGTTPQTFIFDIAFTNLPRHLNNSPEINQWNNYSTNNVKILFQMVMIQSCQGSQTDPQLSPLGYSVAQTECRSLSWGAGIVRAAQGDMFQLHILGCLVVTSTFVRDATSTRRRNQRNPTTKLGVQTQAAELLSRLQWEYI